MLTLQRVANGFIVHLVPAQAANFATKLGVFDGEFMNSPSYTDATTAAAGGDLCRRR